MNKVKYRTGYIIIFFIDNIVGEVNFVFISSTFAKFIYFVSQPTFSVLISGLGVTVATFFSKCKEFLVVKIVVAVKYSYYIVYTAH